MTNEYKKALAAAETEMATVEQELQQLEKRQAQLRATIAGLRSLMGASSDSEDMTLTDGIKTVLKGSDSFLGVPQIMANLRMMGLHFSGDKTATIAATLNRMVRNGKAHQGKAEDGRVGYKLWR
jgi:septal ring factor EnvC (AmiA/AmiB activator)